MICGSARASSNINEIALTASNRSAQAGLQPRCTRLSSHSSIVLLCKFSIRIEKQCLHSTAQRQKSTLPTSQIQQKHRKDTKIGPGFCNAVYNFKIWTYLEVQGKGVAREGIGGNPPDAEKIVVEKWCYFRRFF